MLILGTDGDNVICKMHKNEVANLLGLYSRYDSNFSKVFKVGEEIEVDALYKDFEKLKDIQGMIIQYRQFFVEMANTMNKFQIEIKE